MSFYNEEEIKNLFIYLTADDSKKVNDSVPRESIIFGLQNFAMNLPESDVNYLIEQIKLKKEEYITFEEFKRYWITNINNEVDIKNFAKQTMNLLKERIGYDDITDIKINAEKLGKVLTQLKLGDIYDRTKNEGFAKEMVESINISNDGNISLNDIEFLISEYVNYLKLTH